MAMGASLLPKTQTLQFPGTVVQLHSPQLFDDIYNGTDEDDFILSVSIADEDDIAVDVDVDVGIQMHHLKCSQSQNSHHRNMQRSHYSSRRLVVLSQETMFHEVAVILVNMKYVYNRVYLYIHILIERVFENVRC